YDGGLTYDLLTSGSIDDLTTNNYVWDVTGPVSTEVRIRVENVSSSSGSFTDETGDFSIIAPSISIGYVYDPSCDIDDGEIAIDGAIYGQTYDVYYTYNDTPQGPFSITDSEGLYLQFLPPGTYKDIYIEYAGVQSNILTDDTELLDWNPQIDFLTFDNTVCSGSNGQIDVNIVDGSSFYDYDLYIGTDTIGTPDYSASFIDGFTTHSFYGLLGGSYTLVATDSYAPNCIGVASVVVTDNPDLPFVDSELVTIANPSSSGGNDGFIDLAGAVSGGSTEYIYQWYEGADTSNPLVGETDEFITGLTQGDYTVEVEDGGGSGCYSDPVTFNLVDPPVLSGLDVYDSAATTIDVIITVDQISDLYYVITQSNIPPSPFQIMAGEDENGNPADNYSSLTAVQGFQDMSLGDGTFGTNDVSLLPETTYYIYWVADNGYFSSVVYDSFTTLSLPADVI
ncbi:MAG: hypothetical protein RJQ14_26895, partial [Marinoscillum sp.]